MAIKELQRPVIFVLTDDPVRSAYTHRHTHAHANGQTNRYTLVHTKSA